MKKQEIYVDNTVMETKIIQPLHLNWNPKEDITTYELALCLNLLLSNRGVMPYEFDKDAPYARHFEMYDPNI
jgi:hypothetical protein|tara:strand:- start:303 stop:518 length:216 start_codon:yes stop_codon:yes gene_type:complete